MSTRRFVIGDHLPKASISSDWPLGYAAIRRLGGHLLDDELDAVADHLDEAIKKIGADGLRTATRRTLAPLGTSAAKTTTTRMYPIVRPWCEHASDRH